MEPLWTMEFCAAIKRGWLRMQSTVMAANFGSMTVVSDLLRRQGAGNDACGLSAAGPFTAGGSCGVVDYVRKKVS